MWKTLLVSTLKSAQDTSSQLESQARQSADLEIRKAQVKAENTINEARWQARSIIEEAERKARETYSELEQEVQALERQYHTLYNERAALRDQLSRLATDLQEKAAKMPDTEKAIFVSPRYIPKPASEQGEEFTPPTLPPSPANEETKGDDSFFDQL